jgi:hypothetical protein
MACPHSRPKLTSPPAASTKLGSVASTAGEAEGSSKVGNEGLRAATAALGGGSANVKGATTVDTARGTLGGSGSLLAQPSSQKPSHIEQL